MAHGSADKYEYIGWRISICRFAMWVPDVQVLFFKHSFEWVAIDVYHQFQIQTNHFHSHTPGFFLCQNTGTWCFFRYIPFRWKKKSLGILVSNTINQMSSDQNPWLFAVSRGWRTTQLYRDYFISHLKRNPYRQKTKLSLIPLRGSEGWLCRFAVWTTQDFMGCHNGFSDDQFPFD